MSEGKMKYEGTIGNHSKGSDAWKVLETERMSPQLSIQSTKCLTTRNNPPHHGTTTSLSSKPSGPVPPPKSLLLITHLSNGYKALASVLLMMNSRRTFSSAPFLSITLSRVG